MTSGFQNDETLTILEIYEKLDELHTEALDLSEREPSEKAHALLQILTQALDEAAQLDIE